MGAWSGTIRGGLARLGRLARLPLDWALPARCPGCGTVVETDHSFCLACWQRLDFLAGPACLTCAEPLALALYPDTQCGACLADPPPFAAVRAGVAYGEIARTLALKLKYSRRPGVAETMARPMRRAGRELLPGALVVPVPLHRWRLWGRGYNQAALLARAAARGAGGAVAVDLLRRHRATPSLRGLTRRQRARAVAGAFTLHPRWRGAVRGRRFVLVDDVYTTGATLKACARVLLKAGAAEVAVLCWARVVRDEAAER